MHVLEGRAQACGEEIRDRVRAVLKAHGKLLGESWEAQADHADQVVSEVIESQGLEAGLRWSRALIAELRADCEHEAAPAEHC